MRQAELVPQAVAPAEPQAGRREAVPRWGGLVAQAGQRVREASADALAVPPPAEARALEACRDGPELEQPRELPPDAPGRSKSASPA